MRKYEGLMSGLNQGVLCAYGQSGMHKIAITSSSPFLKPMFLHAKSYTCGFEGVRLLSYVTHTLTQMLTHTNTHTHRHTHRATLTSCTLPGTGGPRA